MAAMKTCLRWLALACLLLTLAVWGGTGANTKWTKTSLPVRKVDPVLEMEYTEWEKKFLPGIDFLAAGIVLSALVWGVSAIIRKKKPA